MLPGNFDPAQTGFDLRGVGVRHSTVGARLDFGVLEFDRQAFGQIVVALVIVLWAHTPVGAGLRFHAQHRVDGGLDDVGDERGLAPVFQLLDGFGRKLVAVVVVGSAVGLTAPVGLVAYFPQEHLNLAAWQR